ncbi:hypothetical protein MHI57_10750 [Cytobacillus sp. FSL K6-0129]|uniref:hypothetical protein n=1 Tax=Cytobacillus sp. FSL K6-0129 TaxID=2921421 RepID=UPI0030FB813D
MITTKTSKKQAAETMKIVYREPVGDGAIEFARQFIEGLHREFALIAIKDLNEGNLLDGTDKRVKRCDYCGYWWRDESSRNRKQTCSKECKKNIKTMQRRQQRADLELLNPKPKKKTRRENNYVWWLEYPFWLNEYEMLKNTWKNEVPHSPSKISQISAAKQRDEIIGGKRKPKAVVPYNGDEAEQPKISILHAKIKDKTKPGEVVTTYMSKGEIENYFSSTYTEEQLRMERFRAVLSGDKKV